MTLLTPTPWHSGQHFIAGTRSAVGQPTLNSKNATTGEPTGYHFYQATDLEIEQAAEAAQRAFPLYSRSSPQKRAAFLQEIAHQISALGEDFIELVAIETALPPARIRGEKMRVCHQLLLFAEQLLRGDDLYRARIDRALPDRQPQPRPDIRQCHVALGPIAVFGASNFPLAFSTAGGDTAAALAAGCPVVVKAHSSHMATAERVAQAILQAAEQQQMPEGVFNMLYGDKIGGPLVQHPAIQAVGFTGSLSGGRALFDLAARRPHPIPVFAEMSSINPVIILPQAVAVRGEQVAEELFTSFTLGCGQFCTKPGLVIYPQSLHSQRFIDKLCRLVNQQPGQSMLNTGILESYRKGLITLQQHPDIEHLAGQQQQGNQAYAQLFQATPTLLQQPHSLLQEEIFGPATILVGFENEQQLHQILQSLQGQLTATLIAEEQELNQAETLWRLLQEKAGRLIINGYPTGVEVCDAMVHGGPYPATSDARGTSVGTLAIERFLRPVCWQNTPQFLLPPALQDSNPLGLLRLVNGTYTRDPL